MCLGLTLNELMNESQNPTLIITSNSRYGMVQNTKEIWTSPRFDTKNDIFHAYFSLLSLFVGLAPETNMVCLEIFFDIIVDDIWWFIIHLRPILAKISPKKVKIYTLYFG